MRYYIMKEEVNIIETKKYPKKLEIEIPEDYLCPISHELMIGDETPVVASDGQTYGQASLSKWIIKNRKNNISTIKGILAEDITQVYYPNVFAKKTIDKFLQENKLMTAAQFITAIESGTIEEFQGWTYLEDYFGIEKKGLFPIHLAAKNQRRSSIEFLLESDIDIDVNLITTDDNKKSPLHLLCHSQGQNIDSKLIIFFLLQKSINLTLTDVDGETAFSHYIKALYFSSKNINTIEAFLKDTDVAKFLLANKNNQNDTILHHLFEVNYETHQQAKFFLTLFKKYALDITLANGLGETCLHLAIHPPTAVKIRATTTLPTVNFRDRRTFILYHGKSSDNPIALYYQDTDLKLEKIDIQDISVLSRLIKKLNINNHSETKNYTLDTLQQKTVKTFLTSIKFDLGEPYSIAYIQLLLDAGFDINIPDTNGNTCLHKAAKLGVEPAIIKFLMQNGADHKLLNKDKKTPIHVAKDEETREYVKNCYLEMLEEKTKKLEKKNNSLKKFKNFMVCNPSPEESKIGDMTKSFMQNIGKVEENKNEEVKKQKRKSF
jgi:ankyrin repeat protein